jgi:uncharacterized damage-inducible protein DinB
MTGPPVSDILLGAGDQSPGVATVGRAGTRMLLVAADQDLPSRWTAATVYDDMWVDPDDDPREVATPPVGERETLIHYLDAYRLTLRMKCDGLTAEQLARRSVPPSTLSLLGLVRHLAEVERGWTRRVMRGEEAPRLWGEPGRDADFEGAVGDPDVVDRAFTAWQIEMDATDALVTATEDLGTISASTTARPIALRAVLVHLIEEYARHCGHADLLRECIDGRVGQ